MLIAQVATPGLAVLAIACAGCGGGSKSQSTSGAGPASSTATNVSTTAAAAVTMASGAPLKRSVWIAKGDQICARANAKLSSSVVKTAQDLARLLPQAAIYEHVEATELSKLVAPAHRAADWTEIVGSVQRFSELSGRAGEYSRVGNTNAGIPVFQAANNAQIEYTTIAQRDGFKWCSVP